MINTALIQEQIDSCNECVKIAGYDHPFFVEKRAQWQAILSAVEQQGKQEPVAWLRVEIDEYESTISDKELKCQPAWVRELWKIATPLYASPVQAAAEMVSDSKIFSIRFSGLWLGGKAIVKAKDKESAYEMLKQKWPNIEPIKKLRFEEIEDKDGVFYFDSGDY